MITILAVVLVLFLLGGGGYVYYPREQPINPNFQNLFYVILVVLLVAWFFGGLHVGRHW